MMKKIIAAGVFVAAALLGSGIAYADPTPPTPAPDPNGPKCWVANNEGHQQLTPCGWAYSDSQGWYQVPWGFQAM
jgi:hypothetical protein